MQKFGTQIYTDVHGSKKTQKILKKIFDNLWKSESQKAVWRCLSLTIEPLNLSEAGTLNPRKSLVADIRRLIYTEVFNLIQEGFITDI